MKRMAVVLTCSLLLIGCYRATVQTGLTPSSGQPDIQVWAHSWIYGLVPPSVVEAESQCSNGVATVTTELTFANQLVAALTLSIYTPMTVTVTCAKAMPDAMKDASISVDGEDYAAIMDAFQKASDRSVQTRTPAYVLFEQTGWRGRTQ